MFTITREEFKALANSTGTKIQESFYENRIEKIFAKSEQPVSEITAIINQNIDMLGRLREVLANMSDT